MTAEWSIGVVDLQVAHELQLLARRLGGKRNSSTPLLHLLRHSAEPKARLYISRYFTKSTANRVISLPLESSSFSLI
jgi:hypothetical protein